MVKQEISAGVIVYRNCEESGERLYLLLHYASGHWDFPKGKLEKGESFQQAALRELFEETGLTVTLDEGFRETISYIFSKQEQGRRVKIEKKVVFFVAATELQTIVISHEHQGYAWLGCAEAFIRLTFENAQHTLMQADRYITQTYPNF